LSRPVVAWDARLVAGDSTGDSTYWTGLLHGMTQLDLDFRLLLISNKPKPENIPWREDFVWQCVPGAGRTYWSLVTFPLEARKAGAKVIHAQYGLSPLIGNCGVTTVHDVSFFIGPEWFRPKDRFLLQRSMPGTARRAAAIVTVSESSKSEIERYLPAARGKTFVTHLACPPWIHPVPDAERIVREKFGLEPGYVLTVGTRWPRKNMDLAIEATKGLDRRLVITGKPGWGDAPMHVGVQAVGYVDNETLSALYSAAGLYLAPSRHEGFGLPLVEAFTCGCPVLCSSGGAFPEVAGDAAQVIKEWDPASWSEAIRTLLADSSKLENLRQRGLQRAKAFSWREMARKMAEVYTRVIG